MKPTARSRSRCAAPSQQMRAYHPPLEGRTEKLRLDFNENPIGCSPAVRRALARLAAATISSYPEQETVRRKAARHFGVRPDELLLTNGTDEALSLVVNTFVEAADTVLFAEPTYAMYRFYSELAGAKIAAPRYDAEMQFPWQEILAELKAAPRVFFLPNPNSPTGNLLSHSDLRRILAAAKNTMVVIDEAYFEFSGVTVIPWIRRYKNLIVTRTFSKTAGLAGLRLGCIFVHAELAATMRKAQSPYPVNVAALAAAEAAMQDRALHRKNGPRRPRRQKRTRARPRAPRRPPFPKRRKFRPGTFRRTRKKDRSGARSRRDASPRPLERLQRRRLRPHHAGHPSANAPPAARIEAVADRRRRLNAAEVL